MRRVFYLLTAFMLAAVGLLVNAQEGEPVVQPVWDELEAGVWTNIPGSLVRQAGIVVGDTVNISVAFKDSLVYSGRMPFVNTFGDVAEGKNLGYLNSLLNFSLAINMGNFSKSFYIESGLDW